MRQPDKVARLLLTLAVCSSVFADYWEYSRQYHASPDIWMDVVRGTADAPQQYRIGVVKLADFIARHAHVGLRHGFTLIDLMSGLVAAWLLYGLFERTEVYRRATLPVRWFGAAGFLFLLQFYLGWVTWYQRPETLPSTLMLVATLVLGSTPGVPKAAAAAGMLILAVLQGFIRADVIFTAHVGFLLACVGGAQGFALGRKIQSIISALSILIAGGIQMYLMHFVYPSASYGTTAVLELRNNLTNLVGAPAFVMFMVPWAWLVYTIFNRRRSMSDWPSVGLLLGSAIYVAMWFTVGRAEEVRIFMPYAIALLPLTIICAMWSFTGDSVEGTAEVHRLH